MEAVFRNDTAAVEFLLNSGAQPFPSLWQRGRRPESLLHVAASHGNPDILRLLLANGYSVNGDNVLSSAVTPTDYEASNAPETVKFLLDSGAFVNASNPLGWTALHFAAQSPNKKTTDSELEVLRILLEAGIDTEATGKAARSSWRRENVTAIQIAIIEGHPDKVKVLLEGNASVKESDLFLAIPTWGLGRRYETADLVEQLVGAGLVGTARNENGETPLMVAAIKGFVRSSRFLMEAEGVDLEETDSSNRTALELAKVSAKYNDDKQVNHPWWEHYNEHHTGQCVIIEDLLARGAREESMSIDPDLCSTMRENLPECPYNQHCEDWSPTRAAVFYGCLREVGEHISDHFQTLQARTSQLKEAVITCLDNSDWNKVLEFYLNDTGKKSVSLKQMVTDSDDRRELKEMLDNCLFLVNNFTQPQVKELLISNTNAFDIYSTFYSPLGNLLYIAAQRGHTSLVKMLADPSLDLLEATHVSSKETPLYAAVKNCRVEAVKMLVAAGVKVTRRVRGVSVIHLAIKGNNCDYCPQTPLKLLEALLGRSPSEEMLEVTDEGLATPLIWAARYDRNDILKLLLDLGANVNHSQADARISEGAYQRDPTTDEGFSNQTALHWAARNMNREASEILLAARANPRLKDSGNKWGIAPRTPYDWVIKREVHS